MYKINIKDGSNVFLTSDSHHNHGNIIRFCNRPFVNVKEMDEALINNWNSVTNNESIIIINGDFCFGDKTKWRSYLKQLNGTKYLVLGNHDRDKDIPTECFAGICDIMSLSIGDYEKQDSIVTAIIAHYPLLTYAGSNKGFWNLFGHVHTRLGGTGYDVGRLKYLTALQFDVGVDNNNFTPISYNKLKEIITIQRENEINIKQE